MINYKVGDATSPKLNNGETGVIAHICNDIGAWGAGFVMALSKRWSEPQSAYRLHHTFGHISLGKVQIVNVEPNLYVANMVAQEGIGLKDGREPIRYDALITCLRKLSSWCLDRGEVSIHMPMIGCGLAGGRWEIIEPIVNIELVERGHKVNVYRLEE